jgi:hypothetical protein
MILSFESACGWKFREIARDSEPGKKEFLIFLRDERDVFLVYPTLFTRSLEFTLHTSQTNPVAV